MGSHWQHGCANSGPRILIGTAALRIVVSGFLIRTAMSCRLLQNVSQIMARRLFSLLICVLLYNYSLGVLRKLTWLVFVSNRMPYII